MSISSSIGVWIAALLTLSIYSFLYKDNPFYKFAEHLFVGVSLGYSIVFSIYQGLIPYVWEPLKRGASGHPSEFIVIIPLILGLLFFTRFIPKYSWLMRFPIAFIFGTGAGVAIPLTLQTDVFVQLGSTISPFATIKDASLFNITIRILPMLIGVICTLIYFFFSVEHRGAVGKLSKVGIVFLMVGFGATFGNTIMGRVSLFIERVDFLIHTWLGIG